MCSGIRGLSMASREVLLLLLLLSFMNHGSPIPNAALIRLPVPEKGEEEEEELDVPYSAHFLIRKLFELISWRLLGRCPTDRNPS